jgi:hypothetical protein
MTKTCIRQLTVSERQKFEATVDAVTEKRICPSKFKGKWLKRFGRTTYSVPLGRRKRILFERDRRGFALMTALTHEQYNRFITKKR